MKLIYSEIWRLIRLWRCDDKVSIEAFYLRKPRQIDVMIQKSISLDRPNLPFCGHFVLLTFPLRRLDFSRSFPPLPATFLYNSPFSLILPLSISSCLVELCLISSHLCQNSILQCHWQCENAMHNNRQKDRKSKYAIRGRKGARQCATGELRTKQTMLKKRLLSKEGNIEKNIDRLLILKAKAFGLNYKMRFEFFKYIFHPINEIANIIFSNAKMNNFKFS